MADARLHGPVPRLQGVCPLPDRSRRGLGRALVPVLRARAPGGPQPRQPARVVRASLAIAGALALALALCRAAVAQGTFPAVTLPDLVFATPYASVWHLEGGYDPVFPNECDPPAALEAVSTSGPATVYVTSCHYTPADGLRLVMVVQGPRCAVFWQGVPIEQRHCVSVPMLQEP
jgi:hypothetical protein